VIIVGESVGGVAAVDGNPLSDVKLLQDVKFVMKSGVVYKGGK